MVQAKDLINFTNDQFKGKELVVAIQREPYTHIQTPNGIKVEKSIGGAHILVDAILKKTGGFMVAVAGGDADKAAVDKNDSVKVPPSNPKYTLKRIFLTEQENRGFYYGFANQTIWPLFHAVFIKPKFQSSWWKEYVNVNKKFADAIVEEVKNKNAFVWINDYHFCLLPKMLKKQLPDLKVGVFWHIPWPTYEIFRICPWRKEMLDGLLGADLIGFHRDYQVENFIKCSQSDMGVVVGSEPKSIEYKNHITKLVALPAGADYYEIEEKLSKNKRPSVKRLLSTLGIPTIAKQKIIIGADRVDYTKGIIERLKIIERFLEKHENYRKKIIYVSIGVPSRIHLPEYRNYNLEIKRLVTKINNKYRTGKWQPIYFINHGIPREDLFNYYRIADAALVTPLDDGMNLVAKEFIICANAKKGVLLLSKFAGAAKDLTEAVLINPYDTEGSANALFEALTMKPQVKEGRNKAMKNILKENNVYKWGIDFFKNALGA